MTTPRPLRVGLYLRVSTGEQNTDNQRDALEAWAAQRGHKVLEVYEDAGVSGAKAATARPAFKRLLSDCTRGKLDMVATWSVDRMGRSLQDLLGVLQHLETTGVGLFIHQQDLDTSTPSGKAMFQMVGVFAEFERSMISARVKAGLERVRNETPQERRERGAREGRKIKEIGRPGLDASTRDAILAARNAGLSIAETAEKVGVGTTTVKKVQREAKQQEKAA